MVKPVVRKHQICEGTISLSETCKKSVFLWKANQENAIYVKFNSILFSTLVFKCLEFEFVLNIHQSKLNIMPISTNCSL